MSKGITALDLSDEDMIRLFKEMLGHLDSSQVAELIKQEWEETEVYDLVEALSD